MYYFQELPTPMFQWQRIHLIDELSRRGHIIDTFNPLNFSSPEEANSAVVDLLRKSKYDLFFTNVCYYKMLFPETLLYIKNTIGIPSLCISCDNLAIPYTGKVLAPYFDVVWLTSIETQYLYDRWGSNSVFAPYAANPYAFTYSQGSLIRKVCFIGNPYGSRAIMMNKLAASGIPIDVYHGQSKDTREPKDPNMAIRSNILKPSRWEEYLNRLRFPQGRILMKGALVNKLKKTEGLREHASLSSYPSVSFSDMPRYYADYVLALASTSTHHTDALTTPLPVINLRNFEIPMSGGLEFCKYNAELANYYEEDKEIVFYRDDAELIDKANFYLFKASDSVIFRMKQAARLRSENEHTWSNRFALMFTALGLG